MSRQPAAEELRAYVPSLEEREAARANWRKNAERFTAERLAALELARNEGKIAFEYFEERAMARIWSPRNPGKRIDWLLRSGNAKLTRSSGPHSHVRTVGGIRAMLRGAP